MQHLERFCDFVDFTDTCWLWTGCKNEGGYGTFNVGGKMCRAHRVALVLAGETLIEGLEVCHSCRNRHCVNPGHLRQDTTKANQFDRIADGTDNIGSRNPACKLTEEQALEIRTSDKSQTELAAKYNVSNQLISKIIHKKRWKHI